MTWDVLASPNPYVDSVTTDGTLIYTLALALGSEVSAYDPVADTYELYPALPMTFVYGSEIVWVPDLGGSPALIAIGLDDSTFDPVALALQPVSAGGTWSTITAPSVQRYAFTTVATDDGRVIIAGGADWTLGDYLGDVEVLDLGTMTWSAGPSMPTEAYRCDSAVVDGTWYVFGVLDTVDYSPQVFSIDLATLASWTTLSTPPYTDDSASYPGVAAVAGGKIVVTGGYGPLPTDAVYLYEVGIDAWIELENVPIADGYIAAGIDDTVYVWAANSDDAFSRVITETAAANDDFADARSFNPTITTTLTGDNTDYTNEVDEPIPTAGLGTGPWQTAWWTFTALENGTLTINSFDTGFDTVLAIYSGGPDLADLVEVVSNDDADEAPANQSEVTFDVLAGETFWVQLCGYDEGVDYSGPISLAITWVAEVVNPDYGGGTLRATHFARAEFPDGDSTVLDLSRINASFMSELTNTGAGTITGPLDDSGMLGIAQGDIIAYDIVDSTDTPHRAFAQICKKFKRVRVSSGEESEMMWTREGPGHLAVWSGLNIGHPGGDAIRPVVDDIVWDFTHRDYDDSTWGFAHEVIDVDSAQLPGGWATASQWAPDDPSGPSYTTANTKIIWADDGTVNYAGIGRCCFRAWFNAPLSGRYLMSGAADNFGNYFVDGKLIQSWGSQGSSAGSFPGDGWVKYFWTWLELSAGPHLFAADVTNIPGATYNPAGLAACIWIPGYADPPPMLVYETTGATKIKPYVTTTPGMTWGKVSRLVLEENQAAGRGTYISLGYDDEVDTDGNPWPELVLASKVGIDGLKFITETGATCADIEMDPNGWTTNGWILDQRNPASDVAMEIATGDDPLSGNIVSLEQDGEDTVARSARVRWAGGWATIGNAEPMVYIELGPQVDPDEVNRIVARLLEVFNDPREQISVGYVARSDLELPWANALYVPGSVVEAPGSNELPVSARALQLGATWNQDELLVITTKVKDLILQEQQRLIQQVTR